MVRHDGHNGGVAIIRDAAYSYFSDGGQVLNSNLEHMAKYAVAMLSSLYSRTSRVIIIYFISEWDVKPSPAINLL